jgi:DNA polymerase III epsilon subunit-like protein
MRAVVIDLETTFSTDHTLKKHSIEEYVRHPKFEIIGAAVVPVLAPHQAEFISGRKLRPVLKGLARDHSFIAHHAQFDGFAIAEQWGISPMFWYDTLSMSRAVLPRLESHSLENLISHYHLGHPKTVPYDKFRGRTAAEVISDPALLHELATGALHDARMTLALFQRLKLPWPELRLIDLTIRLFTEPMLRGNTALLREALEEEVEKKRSKIEETGLSEEALRSDAKFASALRGLGIDPPMKWSAAQQKNVYAFAKTDEGLLVLQEHDDAEVRSYVSARIEVKTSIHESRAARLLHMSERGSVPVYLRFYGAHTGRLSGGDKSNLPNLPRGSKLRRALHAPKGHVLVWGDFSQIECRILATLTGAVKLLAAFRAKRDVYADFGTLAFSETVSRDTPHLRHIAKETVLGCGYGMGKTKFRRYLAGKGVSLDQEVVNRLVNTFRSEYRQICNYWRQWDRCLEDMAYGQRFHADYYPADVMDKKVLLPNEMSLDYVDLRAVPPEEAYEAEGEEDIRSRWPRPRDRFKLGGQYIWGGVVTENYVQALARILLTDAWLGVEERGVPIVFTNYDELLGCVALTDQKAAERIMREEMSRVPRWLPTLPLDVEIDSGDCYAK